MNQNRREFLTGAAWMGAAAMAAGNSGDPDKRQEFVLKRSFIGDNYRIYLLLRGGKYVLRQGEK